MAFEEEDIKQNIIIDYKTNALDTAKQVDVLSDKTEEVVKSKNKNTEATKKEEAAQKTFKTQLREANQELLKMSQTYGETSRQAVEAAKKVANLKDQMQFSKDLVDGFNPDRKFQSLATAVNASAVAASGITSGMALFGAESAETEKALLKVQAAMAFSDAVGRITEMGDDFMKLKAQVISTFTALTTSKTADTVATEVNTASNAKNVAVKETSAAASTVMAGGLTIQTIATTAATIATNILNASLAVLLSPITLVIVAIAGLVAGIAYLSGAIGDFSGEAEKAEKANAKLSKEIDATAKASKRANEEMEFSANKNIALAKASGQSTEAIRKLKEELINQEVAEKRLNYLKAQSIFLEARRVASSEDATEAQKKTSEKAYEYLKEEIANFENSVKTRRQMAVDHRVEIVAEETQKNKDLLDKQKELAKKQAEERQRAHQKELDDLKKLKEDTRSLEAKYLTDLQNINDKSEQEKLDRQKERDLAEIEALRQRGADVSALLIYNAEKYATLQSELDEKLRVEKLEKEKLAAEKSNEFFNEEAQKAIEREEAIFEQKKTLEESRTNLAEKGIAFLSIIAGKNKALQKAAIIAENAIGIGKTLIANAAGNAAAIAQGTALSVTDPSAPARAAAAVLNNNISTGLSVATSIAATAKALSAIGGGSAGGGGGSGSSAPTPSGGNSPQVEFQNSQENQIGTTVANRLADQPPVQAFVVANEVTTAQQLNRNKIEANSI